MAKKPPMREVPDDKLADILNKRGFLKNKRNASKADIKKATKTYQKHHGLKQDGIAGPITERSLFAPRFCGHPDVMPETAELGKWPQLNIKYGFRNYNAQLDKATIQAAARWAFDQWQLVCGIQAAFTENINEASIAIEFNAIDGPQKVLAYSELADGTNNQKSQRYDNAEAFVYSATPGQFEIDLGRVMCHEIGHALGIPHIENGNLMQPIYSLTIRTPQAGDIREATSRYGKPTSTGGGGGTGGGTPVPASPFRIVIEGAGALNAMEATGFRVTKLP